MALFRECSSITDPTIDTSQCYDGQTTEWQYIGGGIGINLPADMAIYQVITQSMGSLNVVTRVPQF